MRSGDMGRRLFIVALTLLAVVAVSYPIWLQWPGSFLVVADPLEKADLIEVLGGGDPQRGVVAAKLFKDGWAPRLTTTGKDFADYVKDLNKSLTYAEIEAWYLTQNGVPPDKITVLNITTTTYEEAQEMRKFMQKNGYKTIIVVTTIYHTRRAGMVFRNVFKGSDLKVIMQPAEGGGYNADHWWTRKNDLAFVKLEYIKMIIYFWQDKI